MNNAMPGQTQALLAHLGQLTVQEFHEISGIFNGHAADGTPNGWPVDWHVETLPYYPVLDALATHCGDCPQCIADGDGETTCQEALVLEHAGHFEITQQFITSLLN